MLKNHRFLVSLGNLWFQKDFCGSQKSKMSGTPEIRSIYRGFENTRFSNKWVRFKIFEENVKRHSKILDFEFKGKKA